MRPEIQQAARWLVANAANPRVRAIPHIRETYGLSLAEAVEAVNEAMRLRKPAAHQETHDDDE